jgi:hypothetical protein
LDKRPVTALELALVGVAGLILLAAALIGDGGGGGDEPRSRVPARPSETPKRVNVRPIARRVERLRALRFCRRLEVTFATPARTRSLLRRAADVSYSIREQLVDEEALKLLGLLGPSTDLREVLSTVVDEQVAGFYDLRSRRLVVRQARSDSRGLQEVTLAHELVHALEDQHFDVRGKAGLSDDAALAETALFEGTATALMSDYADRYLNLRELVGVLESISGTETELPQVVEETLLFPYEEGTKFVTTFRERGSWRAADQVLRLRHPRSTEQILHPEKYAVGERPVRVTLGELARQLRRGWRRLDATTVGELDLRLLFEQVGGLKRPAAAAAGWGGGRFELWRHARTSGSGCSAPCIARDIALMRLAWDSVSDRKEGQAAFQRVFERGLKGDRLRSRPAVGLWSSRGGAIGLLGRRRQTTVVFAPSASIAARLLLASAGGMR